MAFSSEVNKLSLLLDLVLKAGGLSCFEAVMCCTVMLCLLAMVELDYQLRTGSDLTALTSDPASWDWPAVVMSVSITDVSSLAIVD